MDHGFVQSKLIYSEAEMIQWPEYTANITRLNSSKPNYNKLCKKRKTKREN